jgi:hypothetical protein
MYNVSSEMAQVFSKVFSEPAMKKAAAEHLGHQKFDGRVTSSVLTDTNFIKTNHMTQEQLRKIRNAGYKYWDNEVFENHSDWSKREITQFSFEAGAKYALANKYDELKEKDKPNIVQFLKDNGIYEMFWANLLNQNTIEQIIHYMKNYFGTSSTFAEAFVWSRTPEGVEFWREVGSKWNE